MQIRQQITNARRGPQGPRRMIASYPRTFKALPTGISFREYPSITDSTNGPLAALKSLRTAKEKRQEKPHI